MDELKQQIAAVVGVPPDKLKLVHKGRPIHNEQVVSLSDQGTCRQRCNSDQFLGLSCLQYILSMHAQHSDAVGLSAVFIAELANADVILAMKTRPPAAVHSAHEDEEDAEAPEETKLRLPANATALERKLLAILRHDYHVPEPLLMVLFGLSLQTWLMLLAWLAGAPIAHALQVGPIYVLGSLILVIFLNLGRRQQGEASAYSIYNNFQEMIIVIAAGAWWLYGFEQWPALATAAHLYSHTGYQTLSGLCCSMTNAYNHLCCSQTPWKHT